MIAKRVEISPDVLFQELEGETILLDLRSQSYFGLDPVGTRVWQLLKAQTHLEQVVELMSEEFDVEENRLRQDVMSLVQELADTGLIKIEEP